MKLPENLKPYELEGLSLRAVTAQDVDDMMRLQDEMLAALPDRRWYYPSERWEFELGVTNADTFAYFDGDRLIGFAMMTPGELRKERGYALKLGEEPKGSYDFHDVMVVPAYRRRGIHSAFLRLFEQMAREDGGRVIYSTVDPENGASYRNFERAGYDLMLQKPAYDGRERRYYQRRL